MPALDGGNTAITRDGPRIPYPALAVLFLASRLALLIVGIVSTSLMASGLSVQKGNLVYHEPAPRVLDIWARWDSEWYLLIAGEGYDAREHFSSLSVPYEREAAAGFLPLYPMAIRVLSPLMGGVAAGVLISNVCLAVSLILLYRITSREIGGDTGHRAGLAACVALLVFPTSLFLSAVYAESLFLMLSMAVFLLAGNGRYALAGLAGALATLTRPSGMLLAIPLLMEWWSARRRTEGSPGRPRPADAAWVLAIPAAMAGFMFFTARALGDPLALFHRQERWRGAMSGPWRALVRWWQETPAVHGAHDSTIELVIALVFLAMLPAMFRRLRPSYAVYATAAVMLPLCTSVWSFGRFALTAFPAFMLIGLAWAQRRRRLATVYAFSAVTMSGLFMALFANWWWVG